MIHTEKWSRRTFLSSSGLVAAGALLRPSLRSALSDLSGTESYFACAVTRDANHPSSRNLHAYAVRNGRGLRVASMRCADAIGAVAIHPIHKVVYVAHDIESYLGLPRASISSFALNETNGKFIESGREPLSLSATNPRHMAVSPDGKTLLVAATAGGAYNVLSLAPEGQILPNPRSIKLTGCGPHPLQTSARPVFVQFAQSGRSAYACDLGSDRIDELLVEGDVPRIASRVSLTPGTGPCHLVVHPSQRLLAVVGGLRPTLSMIDLDDQSGEMIRVTQELTLCAASLEGSCFDAEGKVLSVSGRTNKGTPLGFTLHVNFPSLSVKQVERREIPGFKHPSSFQLDQGSLLPERESYSLVATNVPLPYSPIATSPENVLPRHLPVKT